MGNAVKVKKATEFAEERFKGKPIKEAGTPEKITEEMDKLKETSETMKKQVEERKEEYEKIHKDLKAAEEEQKKIKDEFAKVQGQQIKLIEEADVKIDAVGLAKVIKDIEEKTNLKTQIEKGAKEAGELADQYAAQRTLLLNIEDQLLAAKKALEINLSDIAKACDEKRKRYVEELKAKAPGVYDLAELEDYDSVKKLTDQLEQDIAAKREQQAKLNKEATNLGKEIEGLTHGKEALEKKLSRKITEDEIRNLTREEKEALEKKPAEITEALMLELGELDTQLKQLAGNYTANAKKIEELYEKDLRNLNELKNLSTGLQRIAITLATYMDERKELAGGEWEAKYKKADEELSQYLEKIAETTREINDYRAAIDELTKNTLIKLRESIVPPDKLVEEHSKQITPEILGQMKKAETGKKETKTEEKPPKAAEEKKEGEKKPEEAQQPPTPEAAPTEVGAQPPQPAVSETKVKEEEKKEGVTPTVEEAKKEEEKKKAQQPPTPEAAPTEVGAQPPQPAVSETKVKEEEKKEEAQQPPTPGAPQAAPAQAEVGAQPPQPAVSETKVEEEEKKEVTSAAKEEEAPLSVKTLFSLDDFKKRGSKIKISELANDLVNFLEIENDLSRIEGGSLLRLNEDKIAVLNKNNEMIYVLKRERGKEGLVERVTRTEPTRLDKISKWWVFKPDIEDYLKDVRLSHPIDYRSALKLAKEADALDKAEVTISKERINELRENIEKLDATVSAPLIRYIIEERPTLAKEMKYIGENETPEFVLLRIGNNLYINKPKEALAFYDEAIKIKPDYAEAWYNRGNSLSVLRKYKKALEAYDEVIKLKSYLAANAWINKGNTYYSTRKFDKALEAYDEALRINPNLAEVLYNKGVVLSNLNRAGEAAEAYNKAGKEYIIRAESASADENERKANYEKALDAFENATKSKPDYADAWFNKGVVLHKLKRYDDTVKAYTETIRLAPNFVATVWRYKGDALREMGNYQEALKAYGEYLTTRPKDPEVLYNKGVVLSNLNRAGEAAEAYNEAGKIYINRAESYPQEKKEEREENYKKALNAFENATKSKPDYADAWHNKGNALFNLGRYEEALEAYNEALKITPNDAGILRDRGDALLRLGKVKKEETATEVESVEGKKPTTGAEQAAPVQAEMKPSEKKEETATEVESVEGKKPTTGAVSKEKPAEEEETGKGKEVKKGETGEGKEAATEGQKEEAGGKEGQKKEGEVKPEVKKEDANNLLKESVANINVEDVKTALQNNADPELLISADGWSVLDAAYSKGNTKIIGCLTEKIIEKNDLSNIVKEKGKAVKDFIEKLDKIRFKPRSEMTPVELTTKHQASIIAHFIRRDSRLYSWVRDVDVYKFLKKFPNVSEADTEVNKYIYDGIIVGGPNDELYDEHATIKRMETYQKDWGLFKEKFYLVKKAEAQPPQQPGEEEKQKGETGKGTEGQKKEGEVKLEVREEETGEEKKEQKGETGGKEEQKEKTGKGEEEKPPTGTEQTAHVQAEMKPSEKKEGEVKLEVREEETGKKEQDAIKKDLDEMKKKMEEKKKKMKEQKEVTSKVEKGETGEEKKEQKEETGGKEEQKEETGEGEEEKLTTGTEQYQEEQYQEEQKQEEQYQEEQYQQQSMWM